MHILHDALRLQSICDALGEVLEAWRRHSHGLCNDPFLITDENVRQVIPDIPEEHSWWLVIFAELLASLQLGLSETSL